jgi:hypothetical protein
MITLLKDFKEFIESLKKNDVRYIVICGYEILPKEEIKLWRI